MERILVTETPKAHEPQLIEFLGMLERSNRMILTKIGVYWMELDQTLSYG